MITNFALVCQATGLTNREISEYLDVRVDTLKDWKNGRRKVPQGVLAEVSDCVEAIHEAAEEMLLGLARKADQEGGLGRIALGLAQNDEEAQSIGFPSMAIHRAVVSHILARSMAVGWQVDVLPLQEAMAVIEEDERREKLERGEVDLSMLDGHPGFKHLH